MVSIFSHQEDTLSHFRISTYPLQKRQYLHKYAHIWKILMGFGETQTYTLIHCC